MYSRALKPTFERLGFHPVVRALGTRLIERRLPSTVEINAGELSARYHVGNRFEYSQFQAYETDPDRTVLADFCRRLRRDDVVWDVGANVGVYTCLATAKLGDRQVVAIEPNPKNAARIEENLELNDGRADVIQQALSDDTGTVSLRVNDDAKGAFGFVDGDGDVTLDVPSTTGDHLRATADLRPPTVVKLDVQGSELAAIRGLRDTIDLGPVRLLYCNVYEKRFETGTEGEELRTILSEAGFDVTRLGEWSGGYFVRATRRDEDGDSTARW